MKLRPEFELLNNQFKQLRANINIDSNFLSMVGDNIRLCEHIAEKDFEKSIIIRATHWWRKRLDELKVIIENESGSSSPDLSNSLFSHKYELTENDREFLRFLRVVSDESPENKDGGA